LASDEKNGPKRRKTRRLGHRYVFFYFLRILLILFVYLGSIHLINRRGGLGWPATTITGPNDASCVVWTKGMYFFIFSRFSYFN
jgi:hypothetical protein